MNRLGLLLSGLVGLAWGAAPAHAEDHAIAVKPGLLGLGVEYTYTVSERLAVRGAINGSGIGFDAVESGIDYDFDLVWDSLSVGVDFHPTAKPLRLSAGLLKNDNRLEAVSRLAGNVTVGSRTYTPAEVGTLSARVGFDSSTAPFVGLGWDWSRNARRFGVSFDLGIVSQGSPEVLLDASGSLVGDPMFESDIAAEQAELEESLDDFDLMPFAAFGLVFRF